MRTSYIEATFPPRESTTTSGLRSEVRRRSFVVKEERDRCDQQNGLSSEGRKKKKKKKQDERNDGQRLQLRKRPKDHDKGQNETSVIDLC